MSSRDLRCDKELGYGRRDSHQNQCLDRTEFLFLPFSSDQLNVLRLSQNPNYTQNPRRHET